MKRRELMKLVSVGLGGLVGVEHLVRAMAGGDPAYAMASCDGTKPDEYYCRGTFTCGPNGVTCDGNPKEGYAFVCKDYECTVGFTCRDYLCKESWDGDFNCTNGFTCDNLNNGQRFDCQGEDPLDAQFNCKVQFTCKPGTRFGCDDFNCEEGNFICAATANDPMKVAYATSIQPLKE